MAVEDIDYSAELILVVDDEEMIREIVCEMFGHLGLKSHAVGSGKEALVELKKERPYTFLLTDISMPVMNGVDLIKKVRKKYPKICTIAMTGHSREYKYIDVVNAGAMDFINKPLGIEELEAKVRRGIIERNIREKLNRMSITDSLTGLYNQRHFYTTLKYEVIRAERQKYKLGLILLDLDNFKYFNDTYGHLAGDELLQKVGEIIEVNIRKGVDSGYRYGGDEFAIILIDADKDIIQRIAGRVEKNIKEECKLGASVGYQYFLDGMTVEMLIEKADKKLYRSKNLKKEMAGAG